MNKREQFINDNIGLVHMCAKKFMNRGIEYEDLFQAGCLGLIKAYDNFDENLGFQFSTYAVSVIIGEIKQSFRNNSSVKVSRTLKDLGHKIKKECELRIKKGSDIPTVSELAKAFEISEEKVVQAMEANRRPLSLSLYDTEGSSEEQDLDIPVAEPDYEQLTDSLALKQILSDLNKEDRAMIIMRFFKNMTQSQTAKILGTTQVQISRRERKILNMLREKL